MPVQFGWVMFTSFVVTTMGRLSYNYNIIFFSSKQERGRGELRILRELKVSVTLSIGERNIFTILIDE